MKRHRGRGAAGHAGHSHGTAQSAAVAIVSLLATAACAGATSHSSAVGGSGGASTAGAGGLLAGGSPSGGSPPGGTGGQFEPECFEPSRASAECTPFQGIELANAASFGSGARFRKLGGRAALLDLGADQPPRVVVALADAPPDTATIQVLEIDTGGSPDLVVTAVWSGVLAPSLLKVETVALACRSSHCELFGAAAGATNLVHLEGFDLPTGVKVTDLAAGIVSNRQDSSSQRWCAYGEGLFCLSETGWETVIPPQTSGTLMAVAIDTPSAAVSNDGRVLVEEGGAWVSHTLPFNKVTSVTSELGIVAVVGPDSVWYLQGSTLIERHCQSTGPLLIALPGWGPSGNPWSVVSQDGIVYQQTHVGTTWCAASTRAPSWIAASARTCGVTINALTISDTVFFSMLGPVACGIP